MSDLRSVSWLKILLLACLVIFSGCAPRYLPSYEALETQANRFALLQSHTGPVLRCNSSSARVDRVLSKLAAASNSNLWCPVVIEKEAWNAKVTADKTVRVYRGLLKQVATDAELAAILGHEIGHLALNHFQEDQKQRQAMQSLMQVVAQNSSTPGKAYNRAEAVKELYQVLLAKPYSRDQELEADAFGLFLIDKAGYAPEAAIAVWMKRYYATLHRKFGLHDTHPMSDDRVLSLFRMLGGLHENS